MDFAMHGYNLEVNPMLSGAFNLRPARISILLVALLPGSKLLHRPLSSRDNVLVKAVPDEPETAP